MITDICISSDVFLFFFFNMSKFCFIKKKMVAAGAEQRPEQEG